VEERPFQGRVRRSGSSWALAPVVVDSFLVSPDCSHAGKPKSRQPITKPCSKSSV